MTTAQAVTTESGNRIFALDDNNKDKLSYDQESLAGIREFIEESSCGKMKHAKEEMEEFYKEEEYYS